MFTEEPNLSSKINAQREKLQDIIAPGFGLTDKLFACNVLNADEKSLIDTTETTFDQNRMLLDFILKSGKCNEFVQALRDSDQTHVANWIEGNGGRLTLQITFIFKLNILFTYF